MTRAVLGFLAAVLPLIATPGASLALLTRHVTTGGCRRAAPVIAGTVSGLACHAALALAGLSALVMQSSRAFAAVRLAGALYLIGLGVWTWRSAGRPRTPSRRREARTPYGQALLGNVLNPKAASIYLTLLPQFVDPRRGPVAGQILVLALAHATLITAWLLGWTTLLTHAARAARLRGAFERITALFLVTLGLRALPAGP